MYPVKTMYLQILWDWLVRLTLNPVKLKICYTFRQGIWLQLMLHLCSSNDIILLKKWHVKRGYCVCQGHPLHYPSAEKTVVFCMKVKNVPVGWRDSTFFRSSFTYPFLPKQATWGMSLYKVLKENLEARWVILEPSGIISLQWQNFFYSLIIIKAGFEDTKCSTKLLIKETLFPDLFFSFPL